MKSSSLFIAVLITLSPLYTMERPTRKKKHLKYTSLVNLAANVPCIGTFFKRAEPNTLYIIFQNGVINGYNCVTKKELEASLFYVHTLSDVPTRIAQEAMYSEDKNQIRVLTNIYCKDVHTETVNTWQDIFLFTIEPSALSSTPIAHITFKNKAVCFIDPDMKFILTRSIPTGDLKVHLYNEKYTRRKQKKFTESIKSIAVHPEKKLCAIASRSINNPEVVTLYSTESWNPFWTLSLAARLLTFSPQADSLAFSSYDEETKDFTFLSFIKLNKEKLQVKKIPLAYISSIAYTPHGKKLKVYDEENRKLYTLGIHTDTEVPLQTKENVKQLLFKSYYNPDHSLKVTINRNKIYISKKNGDISPH